MANPDPATKTPLLVLVTGVSCSGKTAIAKHLRALGHHAISLDGYPCLCSWTNQDGLPVTRPAQPSLAWLRAGHQWRWNPTVLDELITGQQSGNGVVWLCGVAANTTELASRFDLRILLHLDEETMLARTTGPGRTNDFGRTGQSAQWLAERFHTDQDALAQICDVSVSACLPLDQVARQLLIHARQHLLRHTSATAGIPVRATQSTSVQTGHLNFPLRDKGSCHG